MGNGGHVSINRKPFRELMQRFPARQRSDASAFWLEVLMRCNWKDGENTEGRDRLNLLRGQFPFGREKMSEDLGISQQTFRTIRDEFVTLLELTIISTNRGTIGTSLNYDVYVNDDNETNQQTNQQVTSKSPATNHSVASQASQASQELESKDSPPIGDGQAPATPSPPAQKRVRKASNPKGQTDPLTNTDTFLKRVEAEYPNTVLSWSRDAGIVKELLLGRKTAKAEDPQAEAWGLWETFCSGVIDGVFSMTDRVHDIPAFRQHYQLLLSKAGTNGKAHFVCKDCKAPAILGDDGIVTCTGPHQHGYRKEAYGL